MVLYRSGNCSLSSATMMMEKIRKIIFVLRGEGGTCLSDHKFNADIAMIAYNVLDQITEVCLVFSIDV